MALYLGPDHPFDRGSRDHRRDRIQEIMRLLDTDAPATRLVIMMNVLGRVLASMDVPDTATVVAALPSLLTRYIDLYRKEGTK